MNTSDADITIQNCQGDRGERPTLTWTFDAPAGAKFEGRTMLATHQPDTVWIEEFVSHPVQIDAVVRAFIGVAKHLFAPAHHNDGPRPVISAIIHGHKMESHSLAARNVVKAADRVDGIWLHLSPIHCKTLFIVAVQATCKNRTSAGLIVSVVIQRASQPLLAHPITRVVQTNEFDNFGLAAVSMAAAQLQLSGPGPLHHLPDGYLRWLIVAAR
ncbi:hypothetical protein XI01_10280 [Bradyrhizobium sp. CCBAU 21360]|nr:hypothetical protein [Bradyrhizobium sp. CCBAU 21360]